MADVIIQSLRLDAESQVFEGDTEAATSNDPGSRQAGTYTTSDPTFLWDVGFQTNSLINFNMTGLGYRVTIREPSITNTPSQKIYYEPNVQLTGRMGNLSYTFPFDENRTLGHDAPYRNYDVVVEAVDTHTKTSAAGGRYKAADGTTPQDTTFTNSFSYDIFSATNPKIDDFKLTDPAQNVVSRYNTEQWITTDGQIKLLIKNNIPPDWAGGYAYVWTGLKPFTPAEALYQFDSANAPAVTLDKSLVRLPFGGSGENGLITIPTGITGSLFAYMSVSPADAFDFAKYEDGVLTDTQLVMSNVVKIQKRLGFNDKLLFNAWAETEINYNNQQIASDWTNYAVGIKSIVCETYEDELDNLAKKFKWNFNFDKPFPNINYTVMATNTGLHIKNNSQIIKFQDKVQFYRFQGKQFFGILYNGNETA